MSQAVSSAQNWRGIAAEDIDELPRGVSLLLRRRSRALLADLLRPHRRTVAAIIASIIVFNLAVLAGPWLVGIGIDKVPALISTRDPVPIIIIVVEFGWPRWSRPSPTPGSSRRSARWAGR